jgi:hypothetical protein
VVLFLRRPILVEVTYYSCAIGSSRYWLRLKKGYLDQDTVDISGNLARNRQEIAFKFPESSYRLAIDTETTRLYDIQVIGNMSNFCWRGGPIRIYDNSNVKPQDKANIDSVLDNLTQRTGDRLIPFC